MNPSSPRAAPDRPFEDRLARLLDMGFQRTEIPATTESVRVDAGTHKLTQVRAAMGSFVAISVLHGSRSLAEHAIGRAFDEMDRLIGLFNRFDASSPLTLLNDTGSLTGGPPELIGLIERSLAIGRVTVGAFDITVKPIIDLFRDPSSYEPRPAAPDESALRAATELVGARHVEVSNAGVRLKREGMGLTLDGIAKGNVVDGIAATLSRQGVSRFLINAGGDIRAAGTRPDDAPWTIAVRDPHDGNASWDSAAWDPESVPDTITLRDGAVATSGSYEVYFDDERLAHHIIHPRTGTSPGRAQSVTVTAPTTSWADALATAVFVLGPAQGRALIERTEGCECLIIDANGRRSRSAGWHGSRRPARGSASDEGETGDP